MVKINAKYPDSTSSDNSAPTREDESIDFYTQKINTVWPDFPSRYFIEYDRRCLTTSECVAMIKPVFVKIYGGHPTIYKEKLIHFSKNYALFDTQLTNE